MNKTPKTFSYAQAALQPAPLPNCRSSTPPRTMVRLGGNKPQTFVDSCGRTIAPARTMPSGKGMRRLRPAQRAPGAVQAQAAHAAASAKATSKASALAPTPPPKRAASSAPAGAPPLATSIASLAQALERMQLTPSSPRPQGSPLMADKMSLPSTPSLGSPPPSHIPPFFRRASHANSVARQSQASGGDHSSFAMVTRSDEKPTPEEWSVIGDESDANEETSWEALGKQQGPETRGSLPRDAACGDPFCRYLVADLEETLNGWLHEDVLTPATYDEVHRHMVYAPKTIDVRTAMHFLRSCVTRLHLGDDEIVEMARCSLQMTEKATSHMVFAMLLRARNKLAAASLTDVATYLVRLPSSGTPYPDNELPDVTTRRKELIAHWHKEPAGTWTLPPPRE